MAAIKESTASAGAAGGLTAAPARTTASATARESFISIATGSYSSEYDWGDVPGAQVTIDSGAYGTLKSVIFEATVNTPNGNEDVNVRLYNDTDKHPVWFSDLFFPSATATHFLVSKPLSLDPGVKAYKVQMKTQFATKAHLDLARIHIIAN
jgi:hypothetical protein